MRLGRVERVGRLVWFGLVWSDLVWFGLVWFGVWFWAFAYEGEGGAGGALGMGVAAWPRIDPKDPEDSRPEAGAQDK